MEILARFIRLVGWNYTTPLAVYSAGPGIVQYITATDIELVMRTAASHACNLSPRTCQKELYLWSAHSIRVGACVILHAIFQASKNLAQRESGADGSFTTAPCLSLM